MKKNEGEYPLLIAVKSYNIVLSELLIDYVMRIMFYWN